MLSHHADISTCWYLNKCLSGHITPQILISTCYIEIVIYRYVGFSTCCCIHKSLSGHVESTCSSIEMVESATSYYGLISTCYYLDMLLFDTFLYSSMLATRYIPYLDILLLDTFLSRHVATRYIPISTCCYSIQSYYDMLLFRHIDISISWHGDISTLWIGQDYFSLSIIWTDCGRLQL